MARSALLFGEDFGDAAAAGSVAGPAPTAEAAERARREDAAFARGVEEGVRRAATAADARLASVLERGAEAIERSSREIDERITAVEQDALAFFRAVAERLAAGALSENRLAAVSAAAEAAFGHLRGVPHVVIRVPVDLVDGADELFRRMARERGFDGRAVVLGEEELGPGDVRIEWSDGGVTRSGAAVAAAISDALWAAGRTEPHGE